METLSFPGVPEEQIHLLGSEFIDNILVLDAKPRDLAKDAADKRLEKSALSAWISLASDRGEFGTNPLIVN